MEAEAVLYLLSVVTSYLHLSVLGILLNLHLPSHRETA